MCQTFSHTFPTNQVEEAYFVNSDYRNKTIYSAWILISTIEMWRTGLSEMHPDTCIDEAIELFYWMSLVTPKPHFCMYHFEIKTYTQFSIWKKICMLNLAICLPCSDLHLTVVCTLDHDRLVDHILANNRTYTLRFSCAYLKCDKEGSSRDFKWLHIPLIWYLYIFFYIVPMILFPKLLYSYISEARSCVTPWWGQPKMMGLYCFFFSILSNMLFKWFTRLFCFVCDYISPISQ